MHPEGACAPANLPSSARWRAIPADAARPQGNEGATHADRPQARPRPPCYAGLRAADRRWAARWRDIELLVNPNGPLSDAGSRKDNGQTGRKLVMDYYGPRVPIGGGAIYGKPPTHVDRFGARVARELAVEAVRRGAGECLVRAVYAPNLAEPLDVQVEVTEGGGDIRVRHDDLVLKCADSRTRRSLLAGKNAGR